ncbi:conjugal transfer protein TrbL family protein [Fodinicola acaciae]|uniref:conjugal transfer protein TrbL family protein n=1 Tax=Fodinicola acaciae TaxID=2681555 RepID=UPI0013D79FB7|nr:conjugal transfer protein TrbL family protein [Fodinicola acaciae]
MTSWITDAIAGWMASIIGPALTPLLTVLGQTALATPDPTLQPRVHELWDASRIAANLAYGLLIIIGGLLIMTRESVQSRIGIREIAPRLVLGFVTANISATLISTAIGFANELTAAIAGQGVNPAAATAALKQIIGNQLQGFSGLGTLGGFLQLALLIMALLVLVTFIVRMVAIMLLTIAAPLALACHALPQTEKIAATWWRVFAACLATQLGQALCLVVFLRVYLSPAGGTVFGLPASTAGWVNALVAACLLWVLIKMPFWAQRAAFHGAGHRRSRLVGIVKTLIIAKTLGALGITRYGAKAAGAKRAGRAGASTARAARATSAGAAGKRATARTDRAGGRTRSAGVAAGAARPAGPPTPATFSSAPIGQVPLSAPQGTPTAATFSHAAGGTSGQSTKPRVASTRPTAPTFSSGPSRPGSTPSASRASSTTNGRRPAPPVFSSAPPLPQAPGPAHAKTSPTAPRFSDSPARQVSPPPRPGYAAPPVFSDAPPPTPARRRATRPTGPPAAYNPDPPPSDPPTSPSGR